MRACPRWLFTAQQFRERLGTYDFRLVLMAVEGLSGQSGADRWRRIAFDAYALAFIRIPSGGAVMLHLMQPAKAVGRLVGECGEAGFDTQQVGLNDKLEAISSARVAAKFHLDLKALTGADRNSNLGVKPQ